MPAPRYRNDEREPTGTALPPCESCGRQLTRWTAALGIASCTSCAPALTRRPDREPVSLGEALAGAFDEAARTHRGAPATTLVPAQRTTGSAALGTGSSRDTTCRHCGAPSLWHPTVHGRWVLIEPGDWPTGSVPTGRRWRIAGDGTAVNLRAANPTDTCRISHFDTCPSSPAPHDSPTLLSLWNRHARRPA
ncbi:DUF6083 domain-containing protein [Kitasatospora sp. NPDC057223]|uniref:DUF6083 domain-containing protein n=1 Tax=Kitasatospora sp. NPDC057223 TaxID=3346055 RepID=UPI00363210E8